MGSKNRNLDWVNKQRKLIKENFGIESDLIQNGHLKTKFYKDNDSWMWVTGSTPSKTRSRRNSIRDLRKGLRENFNQEVNSNMFSVQFVRCTTTKKVSPPRN
jgi:hypothetical protein